MYLTLLTVSALGSTVIGVGSFISWSEDLKDILEIVKWINTVCLFVAFEFGGSLLGPCFKATQSPFFVASTVPSFKFKTNDTIMRFAQIIMCLISRPLFLFKTRKKKGETATKSIKIA